VKPWLLDLFCGGGGGAVGYSRAGFNVVGVDIRPQPSYPFTLVVGDALEYVRKFGWQYSAIHASPPCQSFTAYRRKGHGVGEGYPDLITATRDALMATHRPYVLENVPGAPLVDPIRLCGSSFRLDVRRHRLFESNVPLTAPPCDHGWQTPRFAQATNRTNLRSTVERWDWTPATVPGTAPTAPSLGGATPSRLRPATHS
jgi:DNA (cytosine-5)-methyltransferase 1